MLKATASIYLSEGERGVYYFSVFTMWVLYYRVTSKKKNAEQ